MDLVVVLLLLGLELEIERDLVALIDDIAVARDHATDVEADEAGDGAQIFLRAGDERVGGIGDLGLGPEDDDVGKHAGGGNNGVEGRVRAVWYRGAARLAIPQFYSMKFPPRICALAISTLLAACNSLDNPLAGMNLLNSGHDGRVFNSQTGEFEWPKDATPRPGRTRKTAELSAALKPTPTPAGDGRYYDTQKGQWVDPPPQSNAGQSPRSRSNPRPAAAAPATPAPSSLLPIPVPATPAPARARGVYNPSTGQIEWQSYDGPPMATPVPKKRWWLF